MSREDIIYKIGFVIMDIISVFSPEVTRMNNNINGKWYN